MTLTRTAVALGRRFGASPDARKRIQEANEAEVWTGRCRKCDAILKGRPSVIREHRCDGEQSPDQS